VISCSICKEKIFPVTDGPQTVICSNCTKKNKKLEMSCLSPRLGLKRSLPFDRGVARTISYGDKFEKSKTPELD